LRTPRSFSACAIHGTLAAPSELDDVAKYLTDAGYVVEVPEMCWSKDRHYDKPYLERQRVEDGKGAVLGFSSARENW
jgi:dienelactone hydrolase